MNEIFPEPISKLPQADMPFEGVKAFLSQSDNHQIVFTSFTEDTEMQTHSHAAQISFVVEGRIDFTIGEESFSYKKAIGSIYLLGLNIRAKYMRAMQILLLLTSLTATDCASVGWFYHFLRY